MAQHVGRDEYMFLLNAHGRRVANRALVTSLPREDRDWALFYECYSPEATLPENERCRTGMVHEFDPLGYSRFYDNHPCDRHSPAYRLTKGLSAKVHDELMRAADCWGEWVIRFLFDVFNELPNDTADSIVDNEGEYYEDGGRFCGWFPGWRGWRAWGESLSAQEERAWRIVLAPKSKRIRHPDPGTPEAELMYPSKNTQTEDE